MDRLRIWLAGLLTLLLWLSPTAAAADGSAVPPVNGPVTRGFDPPAQPWLSGHRGVDLRAKPGTRVVAAMAGRVTYAGVLAGRGVVVVSHGALRTTYLPVRATVAVGQSVKKGEAIGTLESGHACPGGACLHWGLKRGEHYLDPMSLLNQAPLRLLPQAALRQLPGLGANGAYSGARVGLLIGLAQAFAADVGVQLGGRQ